MVTRYQRILTIILVFLSIAVTIILLSYYQKNNNPNLTANPKPKIVDSFAEYNPVKKAV